MKILNKSKFYHLITLCVYAFFSTNISAQVVKNEPKNLFQKENDNGVLITNITEIENLLFSNMDAIVIALPLPNGESANFELTPENIMAEGLAKKYPNIKTFSGVSLDNPENTGRFDITPNGFHGMFFYYGERIFVEPDTTFNQDKGTNYSTADTARKSQQTVEKLSHYKSYVKQDIRLLNLLKYKLHQPKVRLLQQYDDTSISSANKKSKVIEESQSVIKTYRIAISAAAEYTAFNGGTVDSAMAEIITLVNRLNQVYQHDLAVKLELVENNDLLVFTDVNTDPFNNDSDDGDLNTEIINGIIGSDNYDIGHVVNTDGGGLAVLGAVCRPLYKGDGVTGDARPNNDAFYIDYVAHELGHQFGADHTFNGTAGACEGNRVSTSAYEVGSGSTIMSYAGICNDQNLQNHSDAFFHARSIDQINTYLENGIGNTCGVVTGNINNTAVVDAGDDYIIPARTPFMLSGTATDTDNNNLTYSWQQFDLGNKSASIFEQVDDGARPLFRAFLPSSDTTRYFPRLSDVLTSTNTIGESLPSTNRELNFRLMAYDNQGGVSYDETKLTVVDSGEAFVLNVPLLDDIWTENTNNISWQVSNTNVAPINCETVDVFLSQNNGESFDIALANNIANNGNTDISIDEFCDNEINTTQARLKLVCSDNIFYSINPDRFSIYKALSAKDISIASQLPISILEGESIEISNSFFTYTCEEASTITIQTGEGYSLSGQTITPNSDFIGELLVPIIANKDNVSSPVYMVNIKVEEKPEPSPTPEISSSKSSGSMFWLLSFIIVLLGRQGRSYRH
jgi:hypothetical protein